MKIRQFNVRSLLATVVVVAIVLSCIRFSGVFQDGVWSVTKIEMIDYTRPDMPGQSFTDEYIATCRDGGRTVHLLLGTKKTLCLGDSFRFSKSPDHPDAVRIGDDYIIMDTD